MWLGPGAGRPAAAAVVAKPEQEATPSIDGNTGGDAGSDGSADAGSDGSADAGSDGSADAGSDVSVDAGDADSDAGPDICAPILAGLGISCLPSSGDFVFTNDAQLFYACHQYDQLHIGDPDAGVIDAGTGVKLTVSSDPALLLPTAIVANRIVIGSGATVTMNKLGHAAAMGPGAGASGNPGRGAGHGGKGAGSSATSGNTYGNPVFPVCPGSGGGDGPSAAKGGKGGGALLLCARQEIVIDGQIVSNGQGATAGGGASGGSILLIAPSVSGSGSLSAHGGTALNAVCGATGFSGGGGRIAVRSSAGSTRNLDCRASMGLWSRLTPQRVLSAGCCWTTAI